MTGLIPVIFALTILDTSRPDHVLHAMSWAWWLTVFASSAVAWLVTCELMVRMLSGTARRGALEWWDDAAHALMLAWLAWICFALHWTGRIEAYTPAILPWVGMQAIHWWSLASGVRGRDDGRSGSRFRLILLQIRFGMLPMLALLPIFDVCNWITIRTGLQGWMLQRIGLPITMTIGSLALGIGGLVLMPTVLVWLWRAQPMPAGPLLDELGAACRQMHVRVRRLMLWPSDGGRAYNAAVNGVLPFLRYVLFTQDLIEDFPRPQVLAVLGHELGHARHRHLLLYLLFALATLLVALLLADPLTAALAHVRWCRAWSPEVRKCLVTLVLVAVKWRLIFGYLSRACERQADIAGAHLCGDPLIMAEALRSVARHSGQSETAPSWRHYPISERVAFLVRLAADPGLANAHHRQVRIWWSALAALVLALAGILAIIALRAVTAR